MRLAVSLRVIGICSQTFIVIHNYARLKETKMKNYKTYTIGLLIAALFFIGLTRSSEATTYTFQSYDSGGDRDDMDDLDHYYYYSWRIKWNLPAGEEITSARFDIENIWDWKKGEPDILRIYLLDSPPKFDNKVYHTFPGYTTVFSSRYDAQSGDFWNGAGPLVGTWTDPNGGDNGANKVALLTFNLPVSSATHADLTDLTNFITNDGVWGFGLDPDCHYFNDGGSFTLTTQPKSVPEPSTLLLLGSGLIGVAIFGKKRLLDK